jgi:hypothetical protein
MSAEIPAWIYVLVVIGVFFIIAAILTPRRGCLICRARERQEERERERVARELSMSRAWFHDDC